MTAPRIIVRGGTYAVTKRCNQRKAFLGPWHPEVFRVWAYAMARAQEKHGVEVHFGELVMDHLHLSATPTKPGNFSQFLTDVHTDTSKGLNWLLAANRYDAPRELFDSRKPHIMRLMDAEAQAIRLAYDNLNCVAAGLVARPDQMPHRLFSFEAWLRGYIDVPKPEGYFADDEPAVRRLYVNPPPVLYRAFGGDMEKLVYHMYRLQEAGVRQLREARTRPPMGARAVKQVHPWSEPKTLRNDSGLPNQTFAWGARGAETLQLGRQSALEVRGFRHENRECSKAFRDGNRDVVFPFGTYGMVVFHGAAVEPECHLGALVSRPGPTFEDVRAELRDERSCGSAIRQEAIEAVQTAREAIVDDAAKLVEAETLDFASKRDSSPDGSPTGASDADAHGVASHPPSTPVVRHRFDRQVPAGTASRVITLRDKRRGRPKKRKPPSGGRHGSDPPA